ncbi:MAG TPA: glycosyltransferase [Longimicrobium sp.]|nr:glycosyltransferase [Longimicrobium sp.]
MFRVEREGGTIRVTVPRNAIDAARLREAAASVNHGARATVTESDAAATVEVTAPDGGAGAAASALFGAANGYPAFPADALATFRNAENPLLSCIVLLPFNDLFARHVLLPSIIHGSRGHDIEIIVILAGFGIDRAPLRHLRMAQSEMACISKGYNLGVRMARGEYVAIFHDDCYVADDTWIERSLDALSDPAVGAATPELDSWFGVPVAKGVPLVMRRRDWLQLGGYDEYYFVGVEDMDLTTALRARGQRVERLPVEYAHLRGMGSSLVAHESPHQLKQLFGYQVLPRTAIAGVHRDAMRRLVSQPFIRFLEAQYHLHYLDKFGGFLAETGVDVPLRREMYLQMRYPHLLTPAVVYASNREKLLAAYREMMNVDELMLPV